MGIGKEFDVFKKVEMEINFGHLLGELIESSSRLGV